LDSLRDYRRADFSADVAAGITVGVVALPLALAFGIASGVRPDQGLVTAIIGGFIISALGGSRVQIGGPAGAFVALLYGIVEKYGVANLLIATMMAGVLLFAMGALRLGNLVRFVPVSIIKGFTLGIAVIIGLSQVKDLLGLPIEKMPANFFSQLAAIAEALHRVDWLSLSVGVGSLALIVLWPAAGFLRPAMPSAGASPEAGPNEIVVSRWRRITAKLPATLLVIVISSVVVWALALPIATIGSRFGTLPSSLPLPAMPAWDWQTAQNLVAPTLAIAFLCAIESLLCARMADGMAPDKQDRHDPNQELMAQGAANFVTPWFGGIAVTGTIARTVTNVRAGARTPVAGIVHALTLLAVVMVAAPLATHIPLPALAAILLWVAYSMGEWRELQRLKQYSHFYRATFLSTFLLTVVFDLVVAVEVGLVLASLFFIYRISSLTRIEPVALPAAFTNAESGFRVEAYRVFGSLFFGSVTRLEPLLDATRPQPDVLILDMHQMINLDTSGLDALESLHKVVKARGGRLVLTGLNPQPRSLIARSHFADEIGQHNLLNSLDAAITAIAAARR
jgi:SulP family sulfate permease